MKICVSCIIIISFPSTPVINCVPEPLQRGLMLLNCYQHLRAGGHFFLNLPRRCLEQSPYISTPEFITILERIGFVMCDIKHTPKVSLFCLQRPAGDVENVSTVGQKRKTVSVSEWNAAAVRALLRSDPRWCHPPQKRHSVPAGSTDFAISF